MPTQPAQSEPSQPGSNNDRPTETAHSAPTYASVSGEEPFTRPSSGFEFTAEPAPTFHGKPSEFSFAGPESAPTRPAGELTVGSHTVSQATDGAVVVGSQTLTGDRSITQGSGSETAVVHLETSDGKTHVVVEASGKTSTADLGQITYQAKPTTKPTFMFVPTVVTIGGKTMSIGGGATLNADAGASSAEPTSSAGLADDENAAAGNMVSYCGVVVAAAMAAGAALL